MRNKKIVCELLEKLKSQMTTTTELKIFEEFEKKLKSTFEIEGEEWRNIKNFDGDYKISNFGKVKSFKNGSEHILKPCLTENGYHRVQLSKNGKSFKFFVHVLVAQEFIEKIENKNFVNHKDGNKLNNFAENLEWVTHSENQKHAFKTGLHKNPEGSKNPSSKFTYEEIKYIRKNYKQYDREFGKNGLAKKFNVCHTTIFKIISNRSYKNVDEN